MPSFSGECLATLRLLRDRHNVLISGPPGTGKSRLLNEVSRAFERVLGVPVHVPGQEVAIPAVPPEVEVLLQVLPAAERSNRRVFRTVFHQNSKYRDFVTGIVPRLDVAAEAG